MMKKRLKSYKKQSMAKLQSENTQVIQIFNMQSNILKKQYSFLQQLIIKIPIYVNYQRQATISSKDSDLMQLISRQQDYIKIMINFVMILLSSLTRYRLQKYVVKKRELYFTLSREEMKFKMIEYSRYQKLRLQNIDY